MELQQLRIFAAVASELHFSRAAEKLHMAQQAVSFQIKQLEQELGVQLFVRTTRKVALTMAGEALLDEVMRAFVHLELGVEEARRADRGERGRIVVGYVNAVAYSILPVAVKAFREQHPDVQVVLVESTPAELEKKLMAREVDVAFNVKVLGQNGLPPFESTTLAVERMCVAVPDHHPLARRRGVKLGDLADQPYILVHRQGNALLHDCFLYVCQQAGFTPRIVQEAPNDPSVIGLVASGMGIALVMECLRKLYAGEVAYIPLNQPQFEFEFALYRRRDHALPVVERFVAATQEQIGDRWGSSDQSW